MREKSVIHIMPMVFEEGEARGERRGEKRGEKRGKENALIENS